MTKHGSHRIGVVDVGLFGACSPIPLEEMCESTSSTAQYPPDQKFNIFERAGSKVVFLESSEGTRPEGEKPKIAAALAKITPPSPLTTQSPSALLRFKVLQQKEAGSTAIRTLRWSMETHLRILMSCSAVLCLDLDVALTLSIHSLVSET